MEKYNIFEEIIIDKNEEKFFEIFKNETIKVEKIVSNGQKSPDNFWYEQEQREFLFIFIYNNFFKDIIFFHLITAKNIDLLVF
jgi:hypothetical protein